MSIVQDLYVIALRQILIPGGEAIIGGVGGAVGERFVKSLLNLFAKHNDQVTGALQTANLRAWKSLETALTGKSWWDFLTKSAEERALADQIRVFLDSSYLKPITEDAKYAGFFKGCLSELRGARKQGILTGDRFSPDNITRQADDFARFNDPQTVLEEEWKMVERMSRELQKAGYEKLGKLLRIKAKGQAPILAISVQYFFRLEIENNRQLFQGLTFTKLEGLSGNQEKGLAALKKILTEQGKQFDEIMDQVLGKLGVIEKIVGDTNVKVGLIKAGQDEVLKLVQETQRQVKEMVEKQNLQNREVRPSDSLSLSNEAERQMVKKLVGEYRKLPEEKRKHLPMLLNDIGKLQVAVGAFDAAQQDFLKVAGMVAEPKTKAEAFYNAYQAALERKKWDDALIALKQAVAIEPARFAPFPFDRYEPKRILGCGGFGVVFLAQHPILNKPVVIKSILTSELDRTVSELFAEAHALEELDHEAIIRLKDCGCAGANNTRPYIVMDYFEGTNLENYVKTEGQLTPQDMVEVGLKVAKALQAAHQRGLLHRDVKPENVLVRRDETGWKVKLIDFGLAVRPSTLEGEVGTLGPQAQTMVGKAIAGTVQYAAPEQMGRLQAEVGKPSDVYGFGKSCYFALLGTPEPDEEEKFDLPESWRRFLGKCTGRKLENRYSNFDQVLAELAQLQIALAITPSEKPEEADDTPLQEAKETVNQPVAISPEAGEFFLKAKNVVARGSETQDGGFVVFAGSHAANETKPTLRNLPKANQTRKNLIRQRMLIEDGETLKLTCDWAFDSAQIAASVFLGLSADGGTRWKDKQGRTLREVKNANSASSTAGPESWDEVSFFEELTKNQGPKDSEAAQAILSWAKKNDLTTWWGRGKVDGSFTLGLDWKNTRYHLIAVYTYGRLEVLFQSMKERPRFRKKAKREEFREKLNLIPGVTIPEDAIALRPRIFLSSFNDTVALMQFLEVLDWFVQEVKEPGMQRRTPQTSELAPPVVERPEWFYAQGKERIGPLTISQMQAMVRGGSLQPSNMVLKEGAKQWLKAGSVTDFGFSSQLASQEANI